MSANGHPGLKDVYNSDLHDFGELSPLVFNIVSEFVLFNEKVIYNTSGAINAKDQGYSKRHLFIINIDNKGSFMRLQMRFLSSKA